MICPHCMEETPKLHLPMTRMNGFWYCKKCKRTIPAKDDKKEGRDVGQDSDDTRRTG